MRRVAVVTGGTRGIGAAIARRLAAEGMAVAVAARSVTAATAGPEGVEMSVACDVRSRDGAEGLAARVLERFGRIDVLVNNAGISPASAEPHLLAEEDWDAILDTNLKGPFLVSAAVAPAMIRQGGGSVVNIASIAGLAPIPRESAYSASKAGLIGLTRALAFDWAPYRIRVNAVAPGYVATEMNARVRRAGDAFAGAAADEIADGADREDVALHRAVVGRTLARRFGQPEEIAEAVAFLASDRASFVSGETLTVDGGWMVGDAAFA